MLLAEELALIAIDPDSGRHALGTRDNLNACLAGLLVVELHLDDRPESALLRAAGEVLAEAGPKTKAVLSAMSRGLDRRLGMGTWDAVVAGLVEAGVVAPTSGGLRPRNEVINRAARDAVVQRLRSAAAGDEPLDARTAALLSMTGPAQLLELVAPDRSARKHARRRIDHALDASSLQPIAESVRKVLADAAAAAAAAASVAATAAATGSN
jgi:Golgi phosphoprotein 3 (GPP34)